MRNNASIDSSSRFSPRARDILVEVFPVRARGTPYRPKRTLNHIVKYPACISVNQIVNQSAAPFDLEGIIPAIAQPIPRVMLKQLAARDPTAAGRGAPSGARLPATPRNLRGPERAGFLD